MVHLVFIEILFDVVGCDIAMVKVFGGLFKSAHRATDVAGGILPAEAFQVGIDEFLLSFLITRLGGLGALLLA